MDIFLRLEEDDDTGEYVIKYFEAGVYKKGSTYYTDDLRDAQMTMRDMARRLTRAGYRVSTNISPEVQRILGYEEIGRANLSMPSRMPREGMGGY